MKVFPSLFGNEQPIDETQEERKFAREQQTVDSASRDDNTYMATQESRSDLLRWQQDLDDEILSMLEMMMGKVRMVNENGEFYWKEVSKPICNEKFITEVIVPQCKPFMTRNLINSNWDQKLILNRLKLTCNTIANSMADGWDTYKIDFVNFDIILNQVKTTIIAGAYRALNGWTKKIDSTMVKRIESTNEHVDKQQQKKGLWGVFQSG